jgi:hypothetical protein
MALTDEEERRVHANLDSLEVAVAELRQVVLELADEAKALIAERADQ